MVSVQHESWSVSSWLFINDVEKKRHGQASKFVESTKLFRSAETGDKVELHQNLKQVEKWWLKSVEWVKNGQKNWITAPKDK